MFEEPHESREVSPHPYIPQPYIFAIQWHRPTGSRHLPRLVYSIWVGCPHNTICSSARHQWSNVVVNEICNPDAPYSHHGSFRITSYTKGCVRDRRPSNLEMGPHPRTTKSRDARWVKGPKCTLSRLPPSMIP